jgi:hypothetical protein
MIKKAFEIGGKNKTRKQITGIENAYVGSAVKLRPCVLVQLD